MIGKLALTITLVAGFAALFLIIWGAIHSELGLVTAGVALIGPAFGSVIAYYFTQEQQKQNQTDQRAMMARPTASTENNP